MQVDTMSLVFTGNLTKDPESKQMAGGATLTNLRIAVNRVDGKGEQVVSYFDVETWGRTAENAAEYLTKGRKVAVTGELRQSRWENEGQKRQRVYVTAQKVQYLDKPRSSDEPVGVGAGAGDEDIPF